MLLSYAEVFQNVLFQNILLISKTIRVSDSLDPDQARHFDKPNLGPNCMQRVSAEVKGCPR